MSSVVVAALYAGAGALIVALVACVLRRWRLAASAALAAVADELLVCALLVGGTVVSTRSPVDPSMKATMLAAGISEAVNCGLLALAVAVVSGVVWRAARRRDRGRPR
jgi:hypothetical protein